jgi:hypothetical protein
VDIGVWMSADTLEEKLDARGEKNPEHAWNLARWPSGLSADGEHRLFVAMNGAWRGYFKLAKDALYNPDDRTPYTLLFDTRSWTPIPPTPVKRFRGFTYDVPTIDSSSGHVSHPTSA